MRLNRGKHRQLQDGDTVGQLGILEDDVISLIVDPAKEIKLNIELPYMIRILTVKNSKTIREIKQYLIDHEEIALGQGDFDLIIQEFPFTEKSTASNESMPLHYFEAEKSEVNMIVHNKTQVKVIQPIKGVQFIEVTEKTSNADLKEAIKNPKVSDILFAEKSTSVNTKRFVQLKDESGVFQECFSPGPRYCLIENYVFTQSWHVRPCIGGYRTDKTELRVYGEPGVDTVLTLRLRVQHQLWVPVSRVAVTSGCSKPVGYTQSNCRKDDEIMQKTDSYRVNIYLPPYGWSTKDSSELSDHWACIVNPRC